MAKPKANYEEWSEIGKRWANTFVLTLKLVSRLASRKVQSGGFVFRPRIRLANVKSGTKSSIVAMK